MTVVHVIYIPLAVSVGVYIGWMLGTRSVQQAWDAAERKRKRLAAED
ncbi:MAG: hypothetical protein KTR25_16175 [Myxococcales bacterium]|nr:hypothetical protein [Myxococcales bacterium]